MIKIEENDMFSLVVYPELRTIHHTLHKMISGQASRDLFLNSAKAFVRYNCNKWLSDDRNATVPNPEDMEFGRKHWEPVVLEAGWKYWALIPSKKLVAEMDMNRFVTRYESLGVTVELFSDVESALRWLKWQD